MLNFVYHINIMSMYALLKMGSNDFVQHFCMNYQKPILWRVLLNTRSPLRQSFWVTKQCEHPRGYLRSSPEPRYGLWMPLADNLYVLRWMGLSGPVLIDEILHDEDKTPRKLFENNMKHFEIETQSLDGSSVRERICYRNWFLYALSSSSWLRSGKVDFRRKLLVTLRWDFTRRRWWLLRNRLRMYSAIEQGPGRCVLLSPISIHREALLQAPEFPAEKVSSTPAQSTTTAPELSFLTYIQKNLSKTCVRYAGEDLSTCFAVSIIEAGNPDFPLTNTNWKENDTMEHNSIEMMLYLTQRFLG